MITIIKEGKKIFEAICDRCGCEFTYQLEDLEPIYKNYIDCPCCRNVVYHKNQSIKEI